MKLLFDQNLSLRLIEELSEFYPDSIHVKDVGLDRATDTEIWNHAKDHGYLIYRRIQTFINVVFYLDRHPKLFGFEKGIAPRRKL